MLWRERVKALWQNRKYIITFVAFVVIGLAILLWCYYHYILTLNRSWLTYEERIDFVTLWVEIVGFSLAVLGAWIAIFQFQAMQRKPDLYLWIGTKRQQELTVDTRDEWPLILENQGKGVARNIRVRVSLPIPSSPLTVVEVCGEYGGYWKSAVMDQHTELTFFADDGYVCYDEDCEELGVFRMIWRSGELEWERLLEYELRCEGMKRKNGVLVVRLPPLQGPLLLPF